jgi:MoxR-like ATPase
MTTERQAPAAAAAELSRQLRSIAQVLEEYFLGKQEIARLLLISAVAGEHMVIVGPPGTAKSAMIRMFAQLIQAQYFEYLLTRFTEPNELFGPVDITAFREGTYQRRIDGMLPTAEIVFLDEVFKSNSAILNSLLMLLNERIFANGSQRIHVPLISVFGASNEVPNDESLTAIFDRFLLRVQSNNLDSYHFQELLVRGLKNEQLRIRGFEQTLKPVVQADRLHALHRSFDNRLRFPDAFLSQYKGLVFQIRSEGISLSDRRAVKLLKLFAASAYVDGRSTPDNSDFFILKHVWNSLDQADILEEIMNPVLEAHYREHPEARRFAAAEAGLGVLVEEINLIRDVLTSGEALSDVQLFSHLKNLNEIKTALAHLQTPHAQEAEAKVEQLLEHVFASSKFAR